MKSRTIISNCSTGVERANDTFGPLRRDAKFAAPDGRIVIEYAQDFARFSIWKQVPILSFYSM
jgi:hypothetical protein